MFSWCTLLIILSTSSIHTYSGNTRLLIAGVRYPPIVRFRSPLLKQRNASRGLTTTRNARVSVHASLNKPMHVTLYFRVSCLYYCPLMHHYI